MHCHICMEDVIQEFTWKDLFQLKYFYLCKSCEDQLEKLDVFKLRCKKCSRPLEQGGMCQDCLDWSDRLGVDPLDKNLSIFSYNEFAKEQIALYKYRGDYEVVLVWQEELKRIYLKRLKKEKFTLVPIPISEERQLERGFNQAEGIARCIGANINQCLVRTQHTEKQSKRKKKQRMEASNPFRVKGEPPKRALIVDDIYTTGTTIRQAAQCLREAGAEKVESLTLIRS